MPRVELLPVTYDPNRLLMWADENFRRISDAIDKMFSGTAAIPVAGNIIMADGTLLQTSWIELKSIGGDTGIDFARIPGSADFNMRLVNNVDGELAVHGGKLVIDSAVASNVVAKGAGAGFQFRERDGEGDWVWYANADRAYLWRSAYNEIVTVDPTIPRMDIGVAAIGKGTFYGDFATFAHYSRWAAGQYCLMQEWNGTTYLNAYNNHIWLRVNNNNVMEVGTSANRINVFGTDRFGAGHCFRIWDDGEVWCWSVGVGGDNSANSGMMIHNNWIRMKGSYGYYFDDRACGLCSNQTNVITTDFGGGEWTMLEIRRHDQTGGWDTFAIRSRSTGGGSPCGFAGWETGRNAAHIIKTWFSAWEARTWDNGGWGIFRGELEDYSSEKSKNNIQLAREKLSKVERKQKIKRIETKHFNRKRGGCANCMGTGLAKENRRLQAEHAAKKGDDKRRSKKKWTEEDDADLILPVEPTEKCPDCDGKGLAFMHAHDVKTEEAGWFGFISEELEKEFPEAVYYRPSEEDQTQIEVSGISVQALVAVLWEEVKDLEDRLAAVEKK